MSYFWTIFSTYEKAGDIFYLVGITICSKLFQEGEGVRTDSREILYCLSYRPRCNYREANDDNPLIIDSIQLPSKMLLRSRSYVTNLYIKRDLPIREIARQLNASHSTVIECLRRLGIHDKGAKKRVITQGQILFGYNY